MKRALTVVVVALLTAALSGVNTVSQALQGTETPSEEARRQDIATRLNSVATGYIVTIERTDGQRLRAVTVEATPESLTFILLDADTVESQTIPLADIRQVEREGRRVVRIERLDGTTVNAALVAATSSDITVTLLDESPRRSPSPVTRRVLTGTRAEPPPVQPDEGQESQETIPLADIRAIEEVRGHLLRNILIGIGVGLGACAVAVIVTINSLGDL